MRNIKTILRDGERDKDQCSLNIISSWGINNFHLMLIMKMGQIYTARLLPFLVNKGF